MVLSKYEIKRYLQLTGKKQAELFEKATEVRSQYFGNSCFLRAVIEITNFCRKNCTYCEMRHANRLVNRYTLTHDQIFDALDRIPRRGISTIFIQGGEVPKTTELLSSIIPIIKKEGFSIVLCLGNKEEKEFRALKEAGADGYILKFETSNPFLHQKLRGDSLLERTNCLTSLRHLGYHVGTGLICGLPGQSLDSIVDDLYFIGQQRWSMCSVSPFITPKEAPLARHPNAPIDLSLNIIAVLRILQPDAIIPTVSALELLQPMGQAKGFRAGANVITVNFTPPNHRKDYRIYTKDRFLVDLNHAEYVARKAGLQIANEHSLGPVIISEERLKPFFDEKWGQSKRTRSSIYTFKNPLLEDSLLQLSGNGTLYDLGCGDGRYTIPLLQEGYSVTAVDISPCALKRLDMRTDLMGLKKRAELICEDIKKIDFLPNIRLVLLANVLHYLSPLEVIHLISKLTKKVHSSGCLYIGLETDIQMEYDYNKRFIFSNQYEHSIDEIKCLLNTLDFSIRSEKVSKIQVDVSLPGNVRTLLKTSRSQYKRRFTLCEIIAKPTEY